MQTKRPRQYNWVLRPLHQSWAFYALVFGIIAGIVICLITHFNYSDSWIWLVVALMLFGLSLLRTSRLMVALAFIAGIIMADFRVGTELVGQDYLNSLVGETVTLTGTLTESPDTSSGSAKIRLTHLHIGDATDEIPGTIYVQLSSNPPDLERSDVVAIRGKIGDGFGVFAASMFRPELLQIERAEPGDLFVRLRNWFADLVRNYIPSPEAELGLGYLMGMSSGLSDSLSDALRAVGMTHVVVASGTHLGILVGAARRTFGKLSRFAGAFFSILLIVSFVLIVGFTPSMTRAALVASLTLLLGYVGRKLAPWRLLSLAAAITLVILPMYLFNLGWQLSFTSFFGILVVGPCLTKTFYGGKPPPWLANMLLTSLATCLTCAPILAYNFGAISLLSFIANLIILPTLPYVMLLLLLTGTTSFLPWLASIIGKLATLLLDFHIATVNFLSEKTMLIINFPEDDARVFLLYIIVGVILVLPKFWKRRRRKL